MIVDERLIKSPKVSVIITYYNLGEYICGCVESILKQSYQNFEIIIVNDGSDEKNRKILENIKNEKVKILTLNENKGQLIAFLEGVKIALGEFISMVDADDILLPDYLKTLLYIHLNTNYALISSSAGEISALDEVTSLNFSNNKFQAKKTKIDFKQIQNLFNPQKSFDIKENKNPFAYWNWNPSTSAMFRKEALGILNFYNDFSYWKTGADKVVFSFLDLIGGSANISACLFLYRHHPQNNTQTTLTTGKKRILNEKYVDKLIDWNIKIRLDAIKMFINNRRELIKNYNVINYYRMFFRVVFCINLKICIKIIKTLAHRITKL